MNMRWLWWIGVTALLACAWPWVINPGAGLRLNPVDLAEWSTLHPAVQAQQPPLMTTLLLRTPLLLVALLFALAAAGHPRRWWAFLPVALLAAGQLPPFEFFADTGNPNYRQQLMMAALTLILPLLALWRVHPAQVRAGAVFVLIMGLAAALVGTVSAVAEMRGFGLRPAVGPGMIVYSLLLGGSALLFMITGARIKKRHPETPPSVVT